MTESELIITVCISQQILDHNISHLFEDSMWKCNYQFSANYAQLITSFAWFIKLFSLLNF